MSGNNFEYYTGVDMQRKVILAELPEFEKPPVIDVYRIEADAEHQYDLPVHHSGQIIRTGLRLQHGKNALPLGEDNGYQHLWNVASGKVNEEGS